MVLDNNLQFERGGTFAGASGMTLTDISIEHLVGKTYAVKDTEHGTGEEVILRLVKNDSGSAITCANQIVKFGVDAKDFGRYVDGTTSIRGQIGLPIDDAYASGFVIPDNDYFYVVQKGPCNVATHGSSMDVLAHEPVTTSATGTLGGWLASYTEFILGTLDADARTISTTALVWVDAKLYNVSGSGT